MKYLTTVNKVVFIGVKIELHEKEEKRDGRCVQLIKDYGLLDSVAT